MKQALKNRFGVENREGQRQGQTNVKFMESSMGEKSTKVDELSQAQDRKKFEAQDLANEGSLYYKLYKTISFLPSTSFLSLDYIIKESNSCSLSIFYNRIQSQFFNFLTTTCGTKSNHGMKAKGDDMEKELSISYEDTSISLSLNIFLLCRELSFKELKLFLELNASYVTLVGNIMVNPFTCEQALDVAHMFKSSSSYV
ncbi:hypothetical protein M9H77_19707 [Catharanthus roseus]|uniref:Uncharacterized protein n=1 Tax=Catharanthus roseus TaxID=4058 RepID=A0ACC0BB25_CATRO|nr:hypothetical protein M9H77_19707 [Catharanthus roseus]